MSLLTSVEEVEAAEAASLEVAGGLLEIKDSQGHVWAIPSESEEDLSDLGTLHPFGHLTYDDRFHYQIVGQNEVSSKLTEQFVPVMREEVGLKEMAAIEREFGTVPSTIVHTGGGVLMKIPKVLADRRQKRKAAVAKAVRQATEPTPEMLDRMRTQQSRKMKSASTIGETLERGVSGSQEAFVEQDLKVRSGSKLAE